MVKLVCLVKTRGMCLQNTLTWIGVFEFKLKLKFKLLATMTDGAEFIEDLDLSNVCIPNVAKKSQHNSMIWTAKVQKSPNDSQSPIGQMSFWGKVVFVISPGKDKTKETSPTANANCDVRIEDSQTGFISQMQALDKVAFDHAYRNRDLYWPGQELTEKQVRAKHRKLLVRKDDFPWTFRTKMHPTVRKDKLGNIVPNARATVMTRVTGEEDAEEPTDIYAVHDNPDIQDYVQLVCEFPSFYRTDTWFGINPGVPQGWHKTLETARFKRRPAPTDITTAPPSPSSRARTKRSHDDVSTTEEASDAAPPPASRAKVETSNTETNDTSTTNANDTSNPTNPSDDVDEFDDYE